MFVLLYIIYIISNARSIELNENEDGYAHVHPSINACGHTYIHLYIHTFIHTKISSSWTMSTCLFTHLMRFNGIKNSAASDISFIASWEKGSRGLNEGIEGIYIDQRRAFKRVKSGMGNREYLLAFMSTASGNMTFSDPSLSPCAKK